MRVALRDDAVEVVVGPIEVEQEVALIGPGVVGELVEEFVDHRERGRQLREACVKSFSEGSSCSSTGRIWRKSGLTSFLRIGVVVLKEARTAFCAGASSVAKGSSACSVLAGNANGGGELAEAVVGLFEHAGQLVQGFLHLAVLLREGREHGVEDWTDWASLVSLLPSASISRRKLWIPCST